MDSAAAEGSLLGAARIDERIPALGRGQGTAAVARLIASFRMFVYFALGAGPTGIVALATGLCAGRSLLWSLGAGAAIAVFVRLLRRALRRDLDSSYTAADLLYEEAEITIPVAPGQLGRAIVQRFGPNTVVYVRAADPGLAFGRGERVRIVECRDDVCMVEALAELE